MNITEIVLNQKRYFDSGKTRPAAFRAAMLKKLRQCILDNEAAIIKALNDDLGKSDFEAFATEILIVLNEVKYAQKHLKRWLKPRRVSAGILNFPSSGKIYPDPQGVCLIMAPWNYPFQLSFAPLAAAMAAGNTVILKPSNYAPAVSSVMQKILSDNFSAEYITAVEGGRDANQGLLKEQFDYIFFTGGVTVGKLVMESAARFLTPVTLELGGKSPCIVDKTADIDLAARRIVWGKCINAGQTCVAPDYILVQESVKAPLLEALKKYITRFYGEMPARNPEFPKIITEKHFKRLSALLDSGKIIFGGDRDAASRRISPAILDDVQWTDPVMQEELFGPILPVLTFTTIDEAVTAVNSRPHPLALYYFTSDKTAQKKVINLVRFGGGCINDTIMHLSADSLPFGGVGGSGMGSYHGKAGFDTFTHYKSILKKSSIIDVPLRYAPFGRKYKSFRRFL